MTEQELEQKKQALRAEANAHREDVWQGLAVFARVFKGAEAGYGPAAHELRLLGDKPGPLCPKWVKRMVSYYDRRDTLDPVNR